MIWQEGFAKSAYARHCRERSISNEEGGRCAINNTSGGEPALWPCEPIASCDSSGASVLIQP